MVPNVFERCMRKPSAAQRECLTSHSDSSLTTNPFQPDRGKYSIPLWVSYIEFMCVQGRGEAAKRLCYRAIAHLGGCKGELIKEQAYSLQADSLVF